MEKQRPANKNVIELFCMASNFSYDGLEGTINNNLREGDTIEQATTYAVEDQLVYNLLSQILTDGEIKEIANILNNLGEDKEADFLFYCDEG
jgi:hypothetical protein